MPYNSMENLKDLAEKDAEKVYKEAVTLLKKADPGIFVKTLLFAGAGGAAGVMIGVILKDMILQIEGLNLQSLLVLALSAAIGGGVGGFIGSRRLSAMLKPYISEVRQNRRL